VCQQAAIKRARAMGKGRRFEAANLEMLASLAKPYGPKNTQLNTQWVMNNLRDWWKWLPVYVTETRNKEGKKYCPKTIYSLLTGILRRMNVENPRHPNFFR